MTKEKACKHCKTIYEGPSCPNCDRKETIDSFKGKVEIVNAEKSELAQHLKISKNGRYALKL